jgi:hypothetical protein
MTPTTHAGVKNAHPALGCTGVVFACGALLSPQPLAFGFLICMSLAPTSVHGGHATVCIHRTTHACTRATAQQRQRQHRHHSVRCAAQAQGERCARGRCRPRGGRAMRTRTAWLGGHVGADIPHGTPRVRARGRPRSADAETALAAEPHITQTKTGAPQEDRPGAADAAARRALHHRAPSPR